MNKSQTGAKLSGSYSSLTGTVTTGFDFFVNVPATYNQLLSNLIVQKSGHLAGAVCDIFLK